MATGMLGALFNNPQQLAEKEEVTEDRRLERLGALDSFAQNRYGHLAASQLAGQGLGRTAAAAVGADPRTRDERLQAAMKAVGEMEDSDLSKPEGVDAYYKNVIKVLRDQGLAGEAHAAAQEWNEYKSKQTDQQWKRDDLNRKAEEAKRKALIAEEANRIKRLRAEQLAKQGMPEVIQIVERIEAESNAAIKQRLIDYHNAQLESKRKGIELENAGDRVIVRNKATGQVLGVDMMGAAPESEKDVRKAADAKKKLEPAYRSAMLALQTQYKAAADLFNSPGLDDLIGKWTGLAAEYGLGQDGMLAEAAIARLSPEGQEALAVYQQIIGGAFVNALKQLKEAGGGSTGLGQVTEVEGKKVTTATNALFPRQQPASFRRKLADYVDTLEQTAEIMRDAAASDQLAPIGLNIVPLSGPSRGKAAPPAPTRPTAAPRAGTPADSIKVRRKSDGRTGVIPRANFNPEKYEEVK
jgi:hypothetical protein